MRTLIVDDEHFVRKGLIHTLPWESYLFQIVGEADNGQSAVAFMRKHEVDVLFTDLTMPVMNGFELMQQVRLEFPYMWIVVLTCHQDFSYVQEALQLGAIDYLVKTQMEGQNSVETLQRIVNRIQYEQSLRGQKRQAAAKPDRFFLHAWKQQTPECWSVLEGASISPIGELGWLVNTHFFHTRGELMTAFIEEELHQHFAIIAVDEEQLIHLSELESFIDETIFYTYRPDQPMLFEFQPHSKEVNRKPDRVLIDEMIKEWQSLRWIYNDTRFQAWQANVLDYRLPRSQLMELVKNYLQAWKFAVQLGDLEQTGDASASLCHWMDTLQFLQELRKRLINRNVTEEVAVCIYKAAKFMFDNLHNSLGLEEVAQQVGLSRGYFSHSIRQVTGHSYHDMMTAMRIDKASRLLRETNELIYNVAEQSGFRDEKYFSKVFKHYVGLLPTEYRLRAKEEATSR